MKKPLFIAIGVHDPEGLPKLDGVLAGVSEMIDWAEEHGYECIEPITDDPANPEDKRLVTVARIAGLLPAKVLLNRPRIVVYFCGHGLHAPQDQHWVLSAGPDQRRISAVGFRDALESYAPGQVAIFSDACRTAWVANVTADNVVDNYPGETDGSQKDTFFSTRDGAASFAMPESNGNPAYCVFTRALLQALGADEPSDAFVDQQYRDARTPRDVISSQSLADYLDDAVALGAQEVGKKQTPRCSPGFRYPSDIYVEFLDGDGRKSISRGHGGDDPGIIPDFELGPMSHELAASRVERTKAREQESSSEWRGPLMEALGREAVQIGNSRQVTGDLLFVDAPSVSGQAVEVISQWDLVGRAVATAGRQTFEVRQPGASCSAIIRAGSLFTPIAMFADLWGAAVVRVPADAPELAPSAPEGVDLLSWGPYGQNNPDVRSAVEALKGLTLGILRSEDIPRLATRLRWDKHLNPMLGIVAAYLYNEVGDIAGIRRMASYYKAHYQDLPFDIALLARAKLEARDGYFHAHIPGVEEAPARDDGAPNFTWEKTLPTDQRVAGVTPMLRAGWQLLGKGNHDLHRECAELTGTLTNSAISTFSGVEAGQKLVLAFKRFWAKQI